MVREKVEYTDILEYDNPYDSIKDGWTYIEHSQVSVDLEKGVSYMKYIFKRISDNKYFLLECSNSANGFEFKLAEEVIRKEITTYIYE